MQGEEQSPGYGEKHQPWGQVQFSLLPVTLTKYLTLKVIHLSLIIAETSDKVHPAQVLTFCLNSTPQLPGNSQVGLTHYKRGCLPPPPSLVPSCSSPLALTLSPHPFPISSPLSPLSTGSGPDFSTLSFSLPLLLLIPLPMP